MAAGGSAAEGEEDGKNRKRLFHGPHKPGRVLLAYIFQRSLSVITLYEFSCTTFVILATMLVFISRRNVINFFVFPCRPSVGIAGFLSFFFFTGTSFETH